MIVAMLGMIAMVVVHFILLVGSFTDSFPPAARTLTVMIAVYAIILAAKQSPWLKQYLTGWISVLVNFLITVLGLFIAVPADQLYSWNTLVAVIVSVLGSSGIHGMAQSIPTSSPSIKTDLH